MGPLANGRRLRSDLRHRRARIDACAAWKALFLRSMRPAKVATSPIRPSSWSRTGRVVSLGRFGARRMTNIAVVAFSVCTCAVERKGVGQLDRPDEESATMTSRPRDQAKRGKDRESPTRLRRGQNVDADVFTALSAGQQRDQVDQSVAHRSAAQGAILQPHALRQMIPALST